LLAALCWVRSAEITDALVDLLIGLVHKINARADRRVERELIDDLRRVRGKESILFRLAEAAIEHPDDTVREALFPVVGEKTLRELVGEAKANQQEFHARVLHLLQSALVHINTLLIQAVLEVPEFHDLIGEDERRALTPLFWSNINFYGRFRLDMNTRLNLSSTGPTRQPESVL